jgi:hypothetical protein
LIEVTRPTTAPVMIEERPRRTNTFKVKSAAPTRAPPPPTSAPLRAPRLFDSSGNFDNLSNSTFLNLTDGLKSSVYKSDNHFVHQLCSSSKENITEQMCISRESFIDVSRGDSPAEMTIEKPQSNDQDENKVENYFQNKNFFIRIFFFVFRIMVFNM